MRTFLLQNDSTTPNNGADSVLDGLNESQRVAAETTEGPVLIVAGAGSGKTRTLTYRIAHLLETTRARPNQILALTFTNKAAREMIERIVALVGAEAARGLWMGTFHSIFARILRRECGALGYTSDYSIYDSEDSERVVRLLMQQFGLNDKQYSARAIHTHISRAKNDLVSPEEYRNSASTHFEDVVSRLYSPYQHELRRSNAMDFDDLLINPIALFTNHPEVLEKYCRFWRYIHIDEYQDTNHAQYVVTKMLADQHRNLCVVGDDAQSIYAFRGADIGNILNFEQDYEDLVMVRLEQNYRSTKRILTLADSVIRNNAKQIPKTLWTENQEGDYVYVIEAISEKDEAQKIQRVVRDLHARFGTPYGGFAVLYRTNAQSRSLEDAFRRAGIPYEIIGGVNFYQRKEIKDVLAYLRVVVNPADNESLRRIINFPTRGIGKKTLERLRGFAAQHDAPLWYAVENVDDIGLAPNTVRAVTAFRDFVLRYAEQAGVAPADEVTRSLVQETGILASLRDENTIEGLARWENVQELINAVAEFVENGNESDSLSTFLQEVALVTNVDTAEDDVNKVKLMTLHSSKGLEFPVVFVSGLEEGLFPIAGALDDPRELEEERRLLYVGVTRAEERLFLSHARSRFRFGQYSPSVQSRFLDEMDTSVLRSETGRPYSGSRVRHKEQAHEVSYYRDVLPEDYEKSLRPSGPQQSMPRASIDGEESDPATIVPGVQVEHKMFGTGKVITVEGQGDQARATVFFKQVGQKKLVLKFARLRRLG